MIDQSVQLHDQVFCITSFMIRTGTCNHAECNEKEKIIKRPILLFQEHLFDIRISTQSSTGVSKAKLTELVSRLLHDVSILCGIKEGLHNIRGLARKGIDTIEYIIASIKFSLIVLDFSQLFLLIRISLILDILIQFSEKFRFFLFVLRIILSLHDVLGHYVSLSNKRTNGFIYAHEFTIRIMNLSNNMPQKCSIRVKGSAFFGAVIIDLHFSMKIRLSVIDGLAIRVKHGKRLFLRERCDMNFAHTSDKIARIFRYAILHLEDGIGHIFCRLQTLNVGFDRIIHVSVILNYAHELHPPFVRLDACFVRN